MSDFLPAKYILVDFLRRRLVDPRTRSEVADTDSFVATSGQTTFVVTPTAGKMSCVTSVTVQGTAQTKWEDYWIDFRSQSVVFFTGLTVSDAVVVNYKSGTTNWIYWDKPRIDLGATSFPRINVLTIGGSGLRMGNYEAPVESTVNFQIDIWTKESKTNQIFTISSRVYAGQELAEYIASKITEAFEDNEGDMHPALYSYINNSIARDLPFDEVYQCFHKTVEVSLRGLDLNRVN